MSSTLAPAAIKDVPTEARMLEELGCHRAWVGEGRMRRDAVTALTLAAAATHEMGLASGIIPVRTRNVTLTAMTWRSLYELAPDRISLGLGAWWEPIATKAGLPVERPLTAMREHVEVIRRLLRNEEVVLRGEFVDVDGVRFDDPAAERGTTYPVPIYLAAVGPKMLDLAADVADGVLLDFFVPPDYTRWATTRLGERRAGSLRADQPFRTPQLVACFVDRDRRVALAKAKRVLVRYLAQQDHVARHSGADPDLVSRIRSSATWPATQEQLATLAELVPDELVGRVCAVGTLEEVAEQVTAYHAAGADEVVLSPFAEDRTATLRALLTALSDLG